ncbi:MAG: TIGR02996 domain-containing protein [Gemmataceae bacterium]
MNDAAFLAAIRDEPDEDLPRLAYADWLDEHGQAERAEFIRVQVELSHGVRDAGVSAGLLRRQRELLAGRREEWLGPLKRLAPGAVFERGFVCHVSMTAEKFLANAPKILAAHPITRLHFTQSADHLGALTRCQRLEGMRLLDLTANGLAEVAGPLLGGCPYVSRLRSLVLFGNTLQPNGVRALAASPYLSELTSLDLAGNDMGDYGVSAFTEAIGLPKLARLDLASNYVGTAGAEALARCTKLEQLSSLRLAYNRLTRADVEQLTQSRCLARVKVFDVTGNVMRRDELPLVEGKAALRVLV